MQVDRRHARNVAGEEDSSPGYITFTLASQTLGMDVNHVREVLVMQEITPLPESPGDILGVVDVRGTSLPVVDLKSRLGLPSCELGPDAQILVIEIATGSQRQPLGVVVDRVHHVEQIPANAIQPCPDIGISNWNNKIIEGLSLRGTKTIVLLSVDALFGGTIGEFCAEEVVS
ncbi:chemotaxis protein CheW [Palleronia sp.]|uniref:chemotaxis protein CheW n=1 Tax=Palleronia sp. TaxID=1940284 RepID=UPI0035C8643B